MRAVVLTGHGGPERLELREDVPVPSAGPGEIVVAVGAAGVNNTDIWTREGAYGSGDDPQATSGWRRGEALRFPHIQGADVAGRILAVGAGVDVARVGERVLIDPVLRPDHDETLEIGFLGSERDGGFAEQVAVPAANAHPIESPLTDAQLATFPTAYLTALGMLDRAGLHAGESILVTGASGGVGSALVQLALARDARPIALVSTSKQQALRKLGAPAVIARQDTTWPNQARAAAGGTLDAVADVVGGEEQFATLLDLLRPFGRYVTAGAIAGPLVRLDLRTLYLKQLTLYGSTLGTRSQFAELVRLINTGAIKPLLAERYPLDDLAQAQRDFRSKHFIGKLVIEP